MQARFVEDALLEKFTDESDPIHDLGIGKTRYRLFQPKDERTKVLQYLKSSYNIFGKKFEKWVYVQKPLSPEEYKGKYEDSSPKKLHVYKYYITDYDGRDDVMEFIRKWPHIQEYLKDVEEKENAMSDRERRAKQEKEDSRYEYFD
jgi:hypothetical protein